jgi:uncharacterized membrane protein YdbT with pleckstrin-like domain
MGYVDKNLMSGETIIHQTKLNWTEYLKGLGLIILGLCFRSGGEMFGGLLIFAGVLALGVAYLSISSSEFAVTDKRVLIKVGIFKTQSLETLLSKVEGIYVEQGIIGKMVDSGTIIVKGTGGTNTPFKNIDKAFAFKNAVNEQISKL